ncbi:hypothetical protein [Noviherbaspirillum pedocola]|uniref:Uncharacterized protein n=1 Tax=Noviherbaspirillum pedocola TaxID=2801341 RepID=A0A934T0C9_9BURK|nr:hypothetical protein [Noviherbaspirillum pedocola]MBK4739203.1 hypothetical protein [Noviherbaspirillum pedocola]
MKFRIATFTQHVTGIGIIAETPSRESRSRPVPQRDASTREMFAKLRNQEFSADSVHQAFTKALAVKRG